MGPGVGGERYYSVSLNSSTQTNGIIRYTDMTCNTPSLFPSLLQSGQAGEADALEVGLHTISARIPLGLCPVYAVQGSDNKRLFVLNRGSDTVTVINSQNNTLDACTPFTDTQTGRTVTCHPTLPLSLNAVSALNAASPGSGTPPNGTSGMTQTAGPVYAEYNATTSQLVVANYDGGTISVIDVSLDQYGNDSPTFGTTYTIAVGQNPAIAPYPASVTILQDVNGVLRAYTANQADQTVAIVNLSSYTVEKWLPVTGHPRNVVSTANSLYGKVYVASPDSNVLTIIRTDEDIVGAALPVQGNIVDVRVNTQNGGSGNNNYTSRQPGAGQPCYLPPALMVSTYGANYTVTDCQTLPVK
jgi:DNA-binding beta-propeller fold protein YncE